MSRLPCAEKDIGQVPEDIVLPKYSVLPASCANPYCGKQAETEHHVVPKWFTRKWKQRDWALLYGIYGVKVPIKVPVCGHGTTGCHGLLTENKAMVEWDGKQFNWVGRQPTKPLAHQYTTYHPQYTTFHPLLAAGLDEKSPASEAFSKTSSEQGSDGGEKTAALGRIVHSPQPLLDSSGGGLQSPVPMPSPDSPIAPGEKCTTCGRKVPHPKKPSSPVSVTRSFRVPADEAPAFTETLEACQEHLGTASQPYSGFRTMSLALGLLLQDESLRGFAERQAA